MKKILVLLAAMVMTLGANAQMVKSQSSITTKKSSARLDYNRIELGYSPMFVSDLESGAWGGMYYGGSTTWHGLEAAYAHGFHLSQKHPMYIETGGRLAYRGASYTDFLRLTVPVDFTWRFTVGRSGNFKISPYSGFNFGFNLLCDNFDNNVFQFGWELGAKFNYKAFVWGFGFNVDFNPLVSYSHPWYGTSNLNTCNLFISAGYEF